MIWLLTFFIKRRLVKFLKTIELGNKIKFDSERERLAWAELARNEVVMTYLKELARLGLEDIRQLLILDKDKKDLIKSQIYGDLARVASLIERSELALKELNKK